MVAFRPFRALRPPTQLAADVSAKPYDVVSAAEGRAESQANPKSYLRIERSDVDFAPDADPYADAVYAKARANLEEFEKRGYLRQDEHDAFYIYSLEMDGRKQTGVVGLSSVKDYDEGRIKKHEHTREDKELDRVRNIDTCGASTGPVFLMHRSDPTLKKLIADWMLSEDPCTSFVSADGVRHQVWTVDQSDAIKKIEQTFAAFSATYIADGHHRAAAASRVAALRRQLGRGPSVADFLTVIFPEDELRIMDYNRVVGTFGDRDLSGFLAALDKSFIIEESTGPVSPSKPREFGLYAAGIWRRLRLRPEVRVADDPSRRLDVAILQELVLSEISGIHAPRTDKRIDFVGGIRGLEELERRVKSGEMKYAISMYPTDIRDLMLVADAGMVMPPKSTWFEPKLRSGLFTHRFQ